MIDLNLERNQLEDISEQIRKLKKLEYLNLNFNPIKKLPEEICELKNLIELDLGKNSELRTLPINFYKLIKLEYLNLESVPLSAEEKRKLPKLPDDVIEY